MRDLGLKGGLRGVRLTRKHPRRIGGVSPERERERESLDHFGARGGVKVKPLAKCLRRFASRLKPRSK